MADEDQMQGPQQAKTMRQPYRWPLITQLSNRATSFLQDSQLVNCYAEQSAATGDFQVEKRFGIGGAAVTLTGPTGAGQGMFNWQLPKINTFSNVTFIVEGNELYEVSVKPVGPSHIPTQVVTDLGPIITAKGFAASGQGNVKFCCVPAGQKPYVIFGSGLSAPAYYIQFNGLGPTPIVDTFFTTLELVPGFAYLDGTTYVMDFNGAIYGSLGFNDPTVWDPLNVIDANAYPDIAVCLASQLTYIIALKSTSTQVFFDNGNLTGSPLSPLPGAIIPYGCLSADTVTEIDGILFWITNDVNNVNQIAMMENLEFNIISTPAVDRLLNLNTEQSTLPFEGIYSLNCFTFKFGGHRFYVVTNVAANTSMVYDMDQKLWLRWTDPAGNFYRPSAIATDMKKNLMVQDAITGAINFFGPDYQFPTDNGVVFPVDIYTPNFDAGIDREKFLSQMRFNTDQVPGSQLLVRFSDNDYQSFNSYRRVDLSTQRPILNDEGSFYRRAYHFRHLAATKFRIRSVDLQMDLGVL